LQHLPACESCSLVAGPRMTVSTKDKFIRMSNTEQKELSQSVQSQAIYHAEHLEFLAYLNFANK
jgi:hypothetical protein